MFEVQQKMQIRKQKTLYLQKKIDFYLNTLATPSPLRYHLEGYAWDKHGMVTEKIGITQIEESYK